MKDIRILLIEDSEDDAALVTHHLRQLEGALTVARVDTSAALAAALDAGDWDLVISDFRLPKFSGMAALKQVRERGGDVPFIIVSATIGEEVAVEAMRTGANDYVMKGNLARLLPAVQRELRDAELRAENRATREAQQRQIEHLAYYDGVTGLANRILFRDRLAQAIDSAARDHGRIAVFVMDIARFRAINDTLGSRLGDVLLRKAAARLVLCNSEMARIGRVGSDRFAVMLPQTGPVEEVARSVETQLAACFAAPFDAEGTQLRVVAAAGIALYPSDGVDADTLLQNAEVAVSRATTSREKYLFYTEEMSAHSAHKLALEDRLRRAVDNAEFVLHYQPKVHSVTRKIVAVEALLRWQSPDLGLVPPAQFIPLLEETGMIVEVGAWVLARAIRDHRAWHEQGLDAPRIAVNMSIVQLRSRAFLDMVKSALMQGADPPGVDLEITESLLMEDIESGIETLRALRALGIGIAIDDFGMGFSSLSYLVKLPVQTLKIDVSFIAAMVDNADTRTLVATIIALAHALRLNVVAEGVESEQQASALCEMHCDEMQGYLVGRPVPCEEMTAMLGALR